MSFGDLLVHEVDIWRPSRVKDGYGGMTTVYDNLQLSMPCKIRSLKGDEILYDERSVPRADYKMLFKPLEDFKEDDLVFWREPIKVVRATGTITSHDGSSLWIADTSRSEDDDYWNDGKLVVTTGSETETKIVSDFSLSDGKITPTEAFTITLTDDVTTYVLETRVKFNVAWIGQAYFGSLAFQKARLKRLG